MAKARNRTAAPLPPPPPASSADDELAVLSPDAGGVPLPSASEIEVDQLIADLGASASDARIIVHRIEANQDPEECVDCPLPVFSKDRLREEFGAGRYRCEVRHKGTIKRRWEWRFAKKLSATAAAPARSPDSELAGEIRRMQDKENERTHALILALIGRPQAEVKGLTLGDLLSTLAQAKDVMGLGGEKASPIAQMKELLEVQEMLGGGGKDKEPGMAGLALEGMRQFGKLLDRDREERAKPRALPAPGAEKSATDAPPAPKKSARDEIVDLLLHHAAQESEPKLAAQFVYEKLELFPEDEFQTACSYLDSPGALGLVMMFEPRLVPAKAWLQKVLEEIRAILSPPEGESELPSGAPSGSSVGGTEAKD